MFKRIKRTTVYKDAWLKLFRDDLQFPDGTVGTYAVVERMNGVGVVVITATKQLLLQREYRYAIDAFSWEIQGGGINQGETPAEAAVRELREEAGIDVPTSALRKLGELYPLNSFNTEKNALFMVKVAQSTLLGDYEEAGELIVERKFFSYDDVERMIDRGEITDAFTIAAVEMAMRRSQ